MQHNVTRRDFLKFLGAGGAAMAFGSAKCEMQSAEDANAQLCTSHSALRTRRLDPDLTILFSDCHVNGVHDESNPSLPVYQAERLERAVAQMLALDPLPARAVCFGDLSYLWGLKEDYELGARLLKPLADAGIALTIGMGNHDRRSTFLEVFPDYAKTTKIPGKIVSVVDAGAVDFIMLDGLQGSDTRGERDMGPGNGAFCKDQQDWLMAELPKWKKPVFVCSHWGMGGLRVGNKSLHKFLIDMPTVAGYIHGHDHLWKMGFAHESWKSPRLMKSLCLPSTGHWGDIGWTLMRTDAAAAKVELKIDDWYFPRPDPLLPGANKAQWRLNLEEKRGQTCSFALPCA